MNALPNQPYWMFAIKLIAISAYWVRARGIFGVNSLGGEP